VSEPGEPLGLFAGYGIELEYMIVNRDTLDVFPASDRVLKAAAGEYVTEIEEGPIGWSNELALHLIELKTNGPVPQLAPLPGLFGAEIARIETILAEHHGRLMPTAMHPWMNPMLETRLWPHGYNEIYEAYNRIFDCRGHGWANLQSIHLNLPFANDEEFSRLHTAIRALLPILPAIAASSPIVEWELTGLMDTRLETYRTNSKRIPTVSGLVVPESVHSRREYEQVILEPMYAEIAPYDPGSVLQYEWLNSRGAIARFDRNAIEIRVLDMQECPCMDISVSGAIAAVLQAACAGAWADTLRMAGIATEALAAILMDVIRDADEAVITDQEYLKLFRFPEKRTQARELWLHLIESLPATATAQDIAWRDGIGFILKEGCLARRIARAARGGRRSHIRETYRVLCQCLDEGAAFEGID
jgi:carboxylate-amine ligase